MKIFIISFVSIILFSTSIIAQTNNFESEIKNIENLINSKTSEFKKDSTNTVLKTQIDSLKSVKRNLELAKVEYQELISGRYKSKIEALDNQLNVKDGNEKPKTGFFTFDKILSIFALLTSLFFGLLFWFNKKKWREEVLFVLTQKKKNETKTSRLDLFKNDIIDKAVEASKNNNNSNNSNLQNLDRIIHELKERIYKLEQEKVEVSRQQQPKYVENVVRQNIRTILFADAIINERFNKVTEQPNDDTVFEIILNTPNSNSATFDVYKDAYRRVLNNPDFVDGCEKQKLSVSPVDLNIDKGSAVKSDNGKWQISKKMLIKFV